MKNNKFKAIDFFCGAGGLTYGLKTAGIQVLAGIDNNKACKATFEKNNRKTLFLEKDISKYSPTELMTDSKIKRKDDYMIFAACAPCQFWTRIHTNKNKSKKTKNLILNFNKFVKYFKPGFVVVENVPGILLKSQIEILISALKNLGYHVNHSVIDMSLYGIPQKRKRFTLLASRVSTIPLPKPKKKQLNVRDVLGERNGFPAIKAGTRDKTHFLHSTLRLSEKNIQRLKMTKKDGGDRSIWVNRKNLQLPCYARNKKVFSDTYARMWWNRPSPTVTTRFTSISNGRFAHPEENRGISLREGATLQTFPKTYNFVETNMTETAKMIGNAVPPKFAKIIGKQIIHSIKR